MKVLVIIEWIAFVRIMRVAATTVKENLKSGPITHKTPLIGSLKLEDEEDEDDEEVYQTANLKPQFVISTSPSVAATTLKENLKSGPITPKTPLIGSPKLEDEEEEEEEDDDDEEVYQTADLKVSEKKFKEMKVLVIIEWIAFVLIIGLLISSLAVNKLQNY
ncbi:hypothetical protein QYF36_001440 [Acer negundo]|nr:hypothetical protein QYF36_001440 [Acer negundo]